jgi:ketosteroid isomerase-like protein
MTPRIARWLSIALACFALSAAAATPSPPEQEVLALEKAFNAAYLANDLPAYFGYYADDLVALFPEGRTTLAAYRKEWTEYVNAGNRLTGNTISDLQARASPAGDEVTCSYTVAVRTHLSDGKTTNELFQETDIWLKRDGKWQVTHVHYSAAPAPAPPAKKP